jgi:hypothetical protein
MLSTKTEAEIGSMCGKVNKLEVMRGNADVLGAPARNGSITSSVFVLMGLLAPIREA